MREGYDPAYGAAAAPNHSADGQDPLALQILEGKVLPGDQVSVDKRRL